jgi:hypothetical protein
VQIIVKPATIFGPEDRFLNWMAEGMTRSPYFPLLNGGSTQVQPIYAHDVGKALMALVEVRILALQLLSFGADPPSMNASIAVACFAGNSPDPILPKRTLRLTCFSTLFQGYDVYAGKTVQLAGPAEYTYKEVAEFVSDVTSRRTKLVEVPVSAAAAAGGLVEQLVSPVLTRDMVRSNFPPPIIEFYLTYFFPSPHAVVSYLNPCNVLLSPLAFIRWRR